jgi:pyruvate/2-oxoglutarate dehydrogenase complex dihydrolipoamide dehydrogenase (E3) component
MAVDYDLVILGGTDAARWAATTAAQFHARVAVVGHQRYRSSVAGFSDVMAVESAAALADLGVDVIAAEGELVQKPQLQVQTADRVLRSRHYLLALEPPPQRPDPSVLTVDEAYANANTQTEWLVMGDGPTALQLSQSLARRDHGVTLATPAQLLPVEEPEAAMLIQAQLEADGVRVLTHAPPPAQLLSMDVGLSPQTKAVWAQDGKTDPSAMLAALGLTYGEQGLWVNKHLRTSHPRIYACGSLLGGYQLPHIARYEASLAVKNALFLPTRSIDYDLLPWAILTEPALARVGLTSAQARERYERVNVLRQTYQRLESAHRQGQTTGLCQFVTRDDGILVGAHLVGAAAAEMIHPLALAVQQQRTMQEIANWPIIAQTFSEIISQIVQGPHPQQGRLEWLFNRRRRWNF